MAAAPTRFPLRCVEAAIKAGAATTINIPDTVGYSMPEDMARIFRDLRNRVPGIRARRALRAQPQRPRNGGGEYAGRHPTGCGSIDEHHQRHRRAGRQRQPRRRWRMALRTRRDALPSAPNIQTPRILRTSKLLATITRLRRAAEQGGGRPQRLRA